MIIPPPTYIEFETERREEGPVDFRKIQDYLKCENWTCDRCGTIMFGRVEYCVYCKLKFGLTIPKKVEKA